MNFSEHVQRILRQRYIKVHRGENSWEDVVERVLNQAALAEPSEKREQFKDTLRPMLLKMLFVPGGRILSEAGDSNQMMNCAVTPLKDSLEAIFKETLYMQMRLYSRSGSSGFSFSSLTPRGVKTTRGYAAGPVAFMELISKVASVIYQESTRDPGSMGVLRVDHPDILEFVASKSTPNRAVSKLLERFEKRLRLNSALEDSYVKEILKWLRQLAIEIFQLPNFNISVGLTAPFMKHLTEFPNMRVTFLSSQWDDNYTPPNITYADLMKRLAESTWSYGEPGYLFLDNINEYHPLPEKIEATNVCGEQPLLPGENCVLGALNLKNLFREFWPEGEPLRKELILEFANKIGAFVIPRAIRFLDNIISVTEYAHPLYRRMQEKHRKVGLGVMGWADFLLKFQVPYYHKDAFEIAEIIASSIQLYSYKASQRLAEEKGYSKSVWKKIQSKSAPSLAPDACKIPRRNVCLNTIAPTGTTSLIAQTSSGIEPIFAWRFVRYDETSPGGQTYDWHPEVLKYCEKAGIKDIEDFVASNKLPNYFVTAKELSPTAHVDMVATWQEYIDGSISKTVNVKNSLTIPGVQSLVVYAWRKKLKALTIYREGSRELEVLKRADDQAGYSENFQKVVFAPKDKHPSIRKGTVYSIPTGQSTLHVTITETSPRWPIEVFLNVGRAGSDVAAAAEAVGRLISVSLQQQSTAEEAIATLQRFRKQLMGIGGDSQLPHEEGRIRSVWDALGKILKKYLEEEIYKKKLPEITATKNESYLVVPREEAFSHTCKECGYEYVSSEKCPPCPLCGFSKCS